MTAIEYRAVCKQFPGSHAYALHHVSGSSRSLRKEAQLRSAGFDGVIVDENGILQTDAGFDRALELIGPATLKDTFAHISEGGGGCKELRQGGRGHLNGKAACVRGPHGL